MKNPKKILIIIQRSNGDVLFSTTLINTLYKYYKSPQIDLLVNDDTISVARLLPNINSIHTFSYKKKRENRWNQEKDIITKVFRKYDLCINLTASDRSVLYALFASKNSISTIEMDSSKSWWKRILLTKYYYFNPTKHILLNNLKSLSLLNIKHDNIQLSPSASELALTNVINRLDQIGIKDFLIFHPSAQYDYKIYPQYLRDDLLTQLNNLSVPILITGGGDKIDVLIKNTIPSLENIFDWIGGTTLEEYFALSQLSLAYIGMDTLNMHIAAGQNKRIFSIFGPTNVKMWSPWSNNLQRGTDQDKPIQTYDNITIFQADMPCVACGKAGCDDRHGKSECLDNIDPKVIFNEIKDWYQNARI